MAERSFAKEVQDLRIGAGQEFRGEGILAITKALLECGVGYVGGYPGAPVSHLIDVLSDAEEILGELGVHFEANASEAAAAAMLAASVNYPIRGAVTFKGPVGANVAADALANLSSGGVTGGALVILGEDYGEGSSIMQERTHAFATKSQLWLLDPRPNLPSIVKAVRDGFELSEASNTPVILEVRIRACHVYGAFEAEDNRPPPLTVRTDGVLWFGALYLLAAAKRWRRGMLRHRVETVHLERWLALALETAQQDRALATEIVACRRLIKGYSDTRVRGEAKFDKVLAALPMLEGRTDAADWLRRLREAALRDEKGEALEGALKTVASFATKEAA